MGENLINLATQWCQHDKDPATRQQMQNWIDEQNIDELNKALSKRIEFGTAGLRGRMSAGYAYMNHVTVQ